MSLGTVCAYADSVTQPKFRSGLWRFERTLEYVRRPPNENLVLVKTNATRCVDPNIAMTGIFYSPNMGSVDQKDLNYSEINTSSQIAVTSWVRSALWSQLKMTAHTLR